MLSFTLPKLGTSEEFKRQPLLNLIIKQNQVQILKAVIQLLGSAIISGGSQESTLHLVLRLRGGM